MKPHEEALEFRRKTAHLLVGTLIAALVWTGKLDAFLLFGISFVLLSASYFLKFFHLRFPLVRHFLSFFEREKHITDFPGKSAIFFLLGCSLAVLFFSRDIATASILILAFGDSLSCLFGHYFGQIKTPFHSKKHIEGSLFAILVATFVASFFVNFWAAFLASTVAMILEFPQWKIGRYHADDNIIIPLSSGAVLFLISLL